MTKNYCPNCGTKISEQNKFCPECGVILSEHPQKNISNEGENKTQNHYLYKDFNLRHRESNSQWTRIILIITVIVIGVFIVSSLSNKDKNESFNKVQTQQKIKSKDSQPVGNKTNIPNKVNIEALKPSHQIEFESVVKNYAIERPDYDLVSLNIQIRDKAYEWVENNDFQINDWFGKVTYKTINGSYSVWLQVEANETNPKICYEGYIIRSENETAFSNALKINIGDIVNIDGKFDTEYKRSALSGIIKGKKLTESPLNVLQKQYYKVKDFKVVKYSK